MSNIHLFHIIEDVEAIVFTNKSRCITVVLMFTLNTAAVMLVLPQVGVLQCLSSYWLRWGRIEGCHVIQPYHLGNGGYNMAEKTLVMLAKNYDEKRLIWPLYVSEKIDGIAYKMFKMGGKIIHLSRQNKPLKSVQHLIDMADVLLDEGEGLVGELHIPGMDF